jgi:hypothetical protein
MSKLVFSVVAFVAAVLLLVTNQSENVVRAQYGAVAPKTDFASTQRNTIVMGATAPSLCRSPTEESAIHQAGSKAEERVRNPAGAPSVL